MRPSTDQLIPNSFKVIGKDAFRGSGLREIHIPDGVEELCELCFTWFKSLSRVTFGESSSLKVIGKEVCEIHIPDGIKDPMDVKPSLCRVMKLA